MSETRSLGRINPGVTLAALLCLAATGAWAQQQGAAASQIRQACSADFKAYCSGIQPGGGRILACLRDNASKLSPACKEALAAAKAARERQQSGSGN